MHAESTPAGASTAPVSRGIPGTVYLLCFGEVGLHITGNRYARHYLGWTEGDVDDRLAVHLSGQGSPLVRAVVAAGIEVELARTWTEADRHFERQLKKRREAPRLCPVCCAREGKTPRDPAPREVPA